MGAPINREELVRVLLQLSDGRGAQWCKPAPGPGEDMSDLDELRMHVRELAFDLAAGLPVTVEKMYRKSAPVTVGERGVW